MAKDGQKKTKSDNEGSSKDEPERKSPGFETMAIHAGESDEESGQ